MYTFSVESVIRGYHKYKDICGAAIDRVKRPCKREPGNPHDPSAVAIVYYNMVAIGVAGKFDLVYIQMHHMFMFHCTQ